MRTNAITRTWGDASRAPYRVNDVDPDFVFDPVNSFYYRDGSRRTIDEVASWDGVPITNMGALRTHGNDPTLYMNTEGLDLSGGYTIVADYRLSYIDNDNASQWYLYQLTLGGYDTRAVLQTNSSLTGRVAMRSYNSSANTTAYSGNQITPGTDVIVSVASRHTPTEQQTALNGVAGSVVSGGGIPAYVSGAAMNMAIGWTPPTQPSDQYCVCTRVCIWEGDPLGSANLATAATYRTVPDWVKPEKKYLLMYGDSITQGVSTSLLAPLFPAYIAKQLGLGSQGSRHIATRMGATTADLTVSGNEIVSGANTITHIDGYALAPGLGNDGGDGSLNYEVNQFLSRADSTDSVSITGTLGGVSGTLVRTVSGSTAGTDPEVYTFTPDAGETLPVALGGAATWQTDDLYRGGDNLWWLMSGANDLGFGEVTDRFDAHATAMASYLSGEKFVFMAPTTRTNDLASWNIGGSFYNEMDHCRDLIVTLVGAAHYLDTNSHMVENSLDLNGLTATADDLIDIGNDTAPRQVRLNGTDKIHFNDYGDYALVQGWFGKITGLL